MKVCVLGLGEVGLPTAAYVHEAGVDVLGYDIDEKAVERARMKGIAAHRIWNEIPECDIYIICVTTSIRANKSDLSSVYDVCNRLRPKLREDTLLSIESTVPPGTCRTIFNTVVEKRGMLVHVPHRYWVGDSVNHGVKQRRVIGAIDDKSMNGAISFYSDVLGVSLFKASSIETAEMSKITENAYRYIQIAFAEELKIASSKLGIDFPELREACNTKWNIEIMDARDGIGGHCLPKDVRYFARLSKQNLVAKAAIKADQKYKTWMKRIATSRIDR
jgi:nucleotide sugar dehydrogenase